MEEKHAKVYCHIFVSFVTNIPLLLWPWHLSTISPTPLCPAGHQSHALAHMGPWMWWLMHKWEGQILLQGAYKEQKSSLPSTQALIWIALPPHQPAGIQLKLPSLQALYQIDYCKVISKLWSTCNRFVSILEKYLAQYPNRDKFLMSSLERQSSTLWCSRQKSK